MRTARLLFLAALVVGCTRDKHDAPNTASMYPSDSAGGARENRPGGSNRGSELEAPRLIPAMRNQLGLMTGDSEAVNSDNLIAYKNLAGDLINSMAIDLNRAGYTDSGSFKALSDSVLDDLGGRAGPVVKLDRSNLNQHTSRMRRLITLYQDAMRNAGDAGGRR